MSSVSVSNTYTAVRGVKPATLEFFGAKDLKEGERVVGQMYPYPKGYKMRIHEGKRFSTTPGIDLTLWGMHCFDAGSSSELLITEGELDAMSAYQMLNMKTPCISLPSATTSEKTWARPEVMKFLMSFSRIYCSFDSDGKSDKYIEKLAGMLPNRVYAMEHKKYKDANEFLQAGAKDLYFQVKHNAKKFQPENIWSSSEDFLKIYNEDHTDSCTPTGIDRLDSAIEGLMKGKLTVFQAPEGVGKSEFMRLLEFNMLNQDKRIAIMHLEESQQRALLGLVSYRMGTNVTRKTLITPEQEPQVIKHLTEFGDNENLMMFQLNESDDPNSLLDKIRYLVVGCCVDYVFFEPIQDLAYFRHDEGTVEQFLSSMATKLATLARDLNVGIITVAHENDDGKTRDSRMISKRAAVVIQLKRDIMADDETTKNTTELLVIKNRPTSTTGHAGFLRFNPKTFNLEEHNP